MMTMQENKIEDLLLKLIEDVAWIKAKISNIEEQDLGSRIDALEAQNKEQSHAIKALENRNNKMEEYVRNSMIDSKKQSNSLFISLGLAVFSVILNVVVSLF